MLCDMLLFIDKIDQLAKVDLYAANRGLKMLMILQKVSIFYIILRYLSLFFREKCSFLIKTAYLFVVMKKCKNTL